MSGYDFSPLYHASQLAFSPGSTFLATSHADRLIVRSTNNLSVIRTWHLASLFSPNIKPESQRINSVQWSDDGVYIMAFSKAAGVVWVFELAREGEGQDGEVARIECGAVEGLERVEWAKGGREVLGWGEHGLKITIYALFSDLTSVIQNPKAAFNCHSYSPDHRYLAVVERHSGKEFVGVYDSADRFQLIRHFGLQASDVQSIRWSPCGRFIAVVDSHMSYSLYIHSPIGPLLTHFSPSSSTFSLTHSSLSAFSTSATSAPTLHEDPGLGIRHLEWAPGGQYLLLMGWDGKVRILESEGWRCLAVLGAGVSARMGRDVSVWREPEGWVKDTRGRGIVQFNRISHNSPLPTSSTTPSPSSQHLYPVPLSISPSGRHFAYLPPSNPAVLHIYSLLPTPGAQASIKHKAAVVFSRGVRGVQWVRGANERLAVICKSGTSAKSTGEGGGGAVYIWDEEGWEDESLDEGDDVARGGVMEGVGIPNGADFHMSDLQYSPDGTTLALQSKGEFCLMYDTDHDSLDPAVPGHPRPDDKGGKDWETEGLSFVREEEEEDEVYN